MEHPPLELVHWLATLKEPEDVPLAYGAAYNHVFECSSCYLEYTSAMDASLEPEERLQSTRERFVSANENTLGIGSLVVLAVMGIVSLFCRKGTTNDDAYQ